MVDWNGLAEMAPVLAAGFTGKPEILQNTMQAYGVGKKVKDDQALRSFGRELFSLGHPADEMELKALAAKYNIDPLTAMALIKKKNEEVQANKLMKLKEDEATRAQEEWDIKKKTPILSPGEKRKQELQAEQKYGYKPPVNVGEGQTLVDPTTGKVIAQGGAKTPTTAMAKFLQDNPDASPDTMAQFAQSLQKPQVQIDMGQKMETEQQKVMGREFAKQFTDIQEGAKTSYSKLAKLDQFEPLIEQAETGKGAGITKTLAEWAANFGINIDSRLPARQALESISNEFALQLRNPSGGAGMPGALSDRDREYLVNIVPGLLKTPEGNLEIIKIMRAVEKRNLEIAKMARAYYNKNGRFDAGFQDELSSFSEKNSLFGSEPKKQQPSEPSSVRMPMPSSGSKQQQQAPPQAVQDLMNNPQLAPQFKAKYGYLPEGF